jgi:uncharacterized protein YbjT (DUF2867 family)
MTQLDVVTGAFSYSGAAIARQLLDRGHRVRTPIEARPLDFAAPDELRRSLADAHTLYNTFWVRFAHGRVNHEAAVANSRLLFDAAAAAGVQRIVHVSITNPSLTTADSYFRGKALVEQALAGCGVPSHAIARPAILFGRGGVLLNNIAWLLRRLPVFAVGGRGDYRLRPIHVDDLGSLCVSLGGRTDTVTIDAVGPQSVTFRQLVQEIRAAIGSRSVIVPVPGAAIPALAVLLGLVLRDTLLTPDEYRSMAAGLADSAAPATGTIAVTDWVREHGDELGRRYASELDLHFRP